VVIIHPAWSVHPTGPNDSENVMHSIFARVLSLAAPASRGQGLAEYALILALIAIVAIIALIFLGGQVSKILSNVGHSV
jgi:Flp pilus assembly pilin Flp